MTQDVIDQLNKKDKPEKGFHVEMLTHAMGLIKMSRAKMSKQYDTWDLNAQVYKGERCLDTEDIKQATKGKPVKMIMPNTFAQVMTFSSFLFLMFNQNRRFYELLPTGNEDYGTKEEDCEMFLEGNLRYNKWNTLLFQHLLDVGRFGPSILECSWTKKLTYAYVTPQPSMATIHGVEVNVRAGSDWQEYVKYEGNLVRAVSPYRFFPDTRFPLVDFQKGEFCAAEEEYSKAMLRGMQAAGEVAGIDFIEPLAKNMNDLRGGVTRSTMDLDRETNWLMGPSKTEGTVIVTKMQVWIVPSKFTVGPDDKKLGPEEFPVLYHLWYANDNRVIRLEPAYWWHNEFGWSVSQFTPDMHQTLTNGLADLIYRLQDVISWHINSRITDVRRNMRGRLIIDPTGVDTSSVDSEGDIYLRKSAGKSGIDRWIKPLQMADVTMGHMNDAELLAKLMQVVTGVNDNLMGQYNSGRRSAQEARTVLGGAAGRMKLHGHLIWEQSLAPLGKMMLSNGRQSLSNDMFMRIMGKVDPNDQEAVAAIEARYVAFKGDPEEIICGGDYFTFDSTLASEKGFMAQSLQELLSVVLQSDPMAAQRLTAGIDPVKLVQEMQYLRGDGNVKRFAYSAAEQQAIVQEQQARQAAEHAPEPPKITIGLSGKLTPEQEEAAGAAAGLGDGKGTGKPQPTPEGGGAQS